MKYIVKAGQRVLVILHPFRRFRCARSLRLWVSVLLLIIVYFGRASFRSLAAQEGSQRVVGGSTVASTLVLQTNDFFRNTRLYMSSFNLDGPTKGRGGYFQPPRPSFQSNLRKCIAHCLGGTILMPEVVVDTNLWQVTVKGARAAVEAAADFLEMLNRPTPQVVFFISFAEVTRGLIREMEGNKTIDTVDRKESHQENAPKIGLLRSESAMNIKRMIVAHGGHIDDLPSKQTKLGIHTAAMKSGFMDDQVDRSLGSVSNRSLYGTGLYIWVEALREDEHGDFLVYLLAAGRANDAPAQNGTSAKTSSGCSRMWARRLKLSPQSQVVFIGEGNGGVKSGSGTNLVEVAFVSIERQKQSKDNLRNGRK